MVNTTTKATLWKVDPVHTLVEFSGKHMMISTVKGRFNKVEGTAVWDEADISKSSVQATIDATTLVSGEEKRDNHLHSADFLHTENYSTITFNSTRIEPKGENEFRLTGDLTIREITKPITLDVTSEGRAKSPWGQEVAAFVAKGSFNRKDFGLTWNVALEAGGVLVSDTIKIEIHAELVKQQEEA